MIDDAVAIDAGSIAIGANQVQRSRVRDIVVTHPHIDHIATLPIFIDDLFSSLNEPIRVYGTQEVIDILERDVFNWSLYPRFSELNNANGPVLQYVPITTHQEFSVAHLRVKAIQVNHSVPTVGLIITDGKSTIAFSSDTTTTEGFWRAVNDTKQVDALLVEASFPNSMTELAEVSYHLTPHSMNEELRKLNHRGIEILVVHLKPSFRPILVEELADLRIPGLRVMEPGSIYEF